MVTYQQSVDFLAGYFRAGGDMPTVNSDVVKLLWFQYDEKGTEEIVADIVKAMESK